MGAGLSEPASHGPRDGRGFRVARIAHDRRAVLDLLSYAHRVPVVHGLLEVDVTAARARLRRLPRAPTLTAFLVAIVARAVREHPEVNARRAGRRLVVFDAVDMVVTVEGQHAPRPHVVRGADRRTVEDISADLRHAVVVLRAGRG